MGETGPAIPGPSREVLHNDLCTDLWDLAHEWMLPQGQAKMKSVLGAFDTTTTRARKTPDTDARLDAGARVTAEAKRRVAAETRVAELTKEVRRLKEQRKGQEAAKVQSLEKESARLRKHAYGMEAARQPLTQHLAFALARSDAAGMRLQACYRRLVSKEVEYAARGAIAPECPCNSCGCQEKATRVLAGADSQLPPLFEREATDVTQCLRDLGTGRGFQVPTLPAEGNETSIARLASILEGTPGWEQASLLRGGSYEAPVQRATRALEELLPGMPRHPPGLPSPTQATDEVDNPPGYERSSKKE